jgi:ribonuclease J
LGFPYPKIKSWPYIHIEVRALKEVEEGALRAWLRSFGAQAFRLRLSGHYLPHQFRYIVEALRPKDLIPLHTEEAELMRRLFKAALKA